MKKRTGRHACDIFVFVGGRASSGDSLSPGSAENWGPKNCHWPFSQEQNVNNRMKLRGQTSENMGGWKSSGGKSQRGEEQKSEDKRRERMRRKKTQVCEKVGKSRNTVFFQWFVAPEGRKVGSLKGRVRSHVARWETKNAHLCGAKHVSKSKCTKHTMPGALLEVAMSKKRTPFWREHISKSKCTKHTMLGPLLEVKMMKKCTPLWREDARSTFPNQNAQNTPCPEHFWKLWCRKKCTPLWREAHLEVKSVKNWRVRTTFGSWDVQNCGAKMREKHFQVKMYTTPLVRATFGRWNVVLCGRCTRFCTLPKVRKTWGFCGISTSDGRRGTFEEDLQKKLSRGRRSTRENFIRDVRRSGRWFPERRGILEHQIFRFAKMILRDRCSTSYDLASLFCGRRSTLDRWSG